MDISISYDKSKINYNQIVQVEVEASEFMYAYECRAVPDGVEAHRGVGINVLMNKGGYDQDGVVTLQTPSRFVYFNVSGRELGVEGHYNIHVWLQDAQGGWWPKQEI